VSHWIGGGPGRATRAPPRAGPRREFGGAAASTDGAAFVIGSTLVMGRSLLTCRRGAQQVEYILLIGCVVLLAILAFRKFGFQVREKVDRQTETVMSDD
jgi:hypothetical protein